MYKVYLKKNEEKKIKTTQNIVYANEVDRIEGKDKNGSVALVYSNNGEYLGKGFINHLSKMLVRIIRRDEGEIDRNYIKELISNASKFRESLGYASAYRLFFSESDGLSGLIIDKYEDYLVIQISSLGLDLIKSEIVDILVELFSPKGIYETVEEGLRLKEGLKGSDSILYGEIPNEVIIRENNLKVSVDIKGGQKTGYFLDQKENRYTIRKYSKDREVLDCFSNTGGFTINAALNAKSVIALDISKKATDNVLRNAEINNLKNVSVITDDCFKVLRDFKKEGRLFGMIILDPPAFTKSTAEVKDALRGYKDINILAMKILKKGGILASSSCSHFISINQFENMLKESALNANKKVRCLEIRSQAPDHPFLLSSNESEYLKFFVLEVN